MTQIKTVEANLKDSEENLLVYGANFPIFRDRYDEKINWKILNLLFKLKCQCHTGWWIELGFDETPEAFFSLLRSP